MAEMQFEIEMKLVGMEALQKKAQELADAMRVVRTLSDELTTLCENVSVEIR